MPDIMINLASINLTPEYLSEVQSNMRAAVSSGTSFISVDLFDVYWATRFTVYEFWLLQFLDSTSFAQIEANMSVIELQTLNHAWLWNAEQMTVASPINSSIAALFPTLSVVMKSVRLSFKVLFINPVWAVDAASAWYAQSCDGMDYSAVKDYLPQAAQDTILSQNYSIDCATTNAPRPPQFLQKLPIRYTPFMMQTPAAKMMQTPVVQTPVAQTPAAKMMQTPVAKMAQTPVSQMPAMQMPQMQMRASVPLVIDMSTVLPAPQMLQEISQTTGEVATPHAFVPRLWPFIFMFLVIMGLTLRLITKCYTKSPVTLVTAAIAADSAEFDRALSAISL